MTRLRPRLRHLAAAMLAAASVVSCGASIRAVYEGDVRFEHCMALDARPDVKPTLRRNCWEEWTSFYTFGQTRDRVDYAHLREAQLGAASDFDEVEGAPFKQGEIAAVAPDPTSAMAPPPLMVASDGGTPDAAAPVNEDDSPHARCAAVCQQGLDACRKGCRSAPCEQACSARQQRCATRCEQREQRRQGSR
jgi:hypothetical protein